MAMDCIRVGVDVGGTFTDFVLVDDHRKLIFLGKQLTTPRDPSKAIIEGVQRILKEAGVDVGRLDKSFMAPRSSPTPSSSARAPRSA